MDKQKLPAGQLAINSGSGFDSFVIIKQLSVFETEFTKNFLCERIGFLVRNSHHFLPISLLSNVRLQLTSVQGVFPCVIC